MRFGAVILAAGYGRRLGRPKATLICRERSLLVRAIEELDKSRIDEIVVVVNKFYKYWNVDLKREVVVNNYVEKGQGYSVWLGTERLSDDVNYVVVLPVENICSVEVIDILIEAVKGSDIFVKPVFEGRGGHPVVVKRELIVENKKKVIDQGLRVLQKYGEVKRIVVDNPVVLTDIDRFEDYLKWCEGYA